MIEGIDLSGDFQSVDSFHDVASAGKAFVYVKATQGTAFAAGRFAEYRQRIADAGLAFGAYHFLTPTGNGTAQAEFFLSIWTPAPGDLAPMLDIEQFAGDARAMTDTIAAFVSEVERHLNGGRMLLYTYENAIDTQAFVTDDFAGHKLWLAAPGDSVPTPSRTWSAPTIWQYTDANGAAVAGIDQGTDCDRFLGSDLSVIRIAPLMKTYPARYVGEFDRNERETK